ncbi:MAG: SDR family oxidoreductase, partial [Deltaproteobacteria bacterium]|nr:SDR family oxidoreductase [Deltaproteobacteria bacterium]
MLKGKTALITGGATGMGRAIALRLGKEGVNVAINYSRSEKEALETKSEAEALGVKSIICKADVADDEQVRGMVSKTIEEFGRLDILVNSAGVTYYVDQDDLEGLKDEHWDHIMGVNVKGIFHCCRAAATELKRQKGCIINITSVGGLTGMGSSIAYSASKAAAISVTKSLARVMAPEVRVNGIAPGIVLTRWVKGREEHVKRYSDDTPLKRVAQPEDVSEVAYSLIANMNFVTGQNI